MTQIVLTHEGLIKASEIAPRPQTDSDFILIQLGHLTSLEGRGQTSVDLERLVRTGNLSHVTNRNPNPDEMRRTLRNMFEQGFIDIIEPSDTLDLVNNTYVKAF